MVDQESSHGEQILAVAVQHFREQSIPEFPNPVVDFPVAYGQLEHVELKSCSKSSVGPLFPRRRLFLVAAVVFAIVLGGFAVLPWKSANQKAFAQMQEAIRNLNSLVFEMKSYSGDQETGRYQISHTKSGGVRMDSGLVSHILNVSKEEYMIVDDANQAVTIQPVYDTSEIQRKVTEPLAILLDLEPLPSTNMRTVVIEGKLAKEFKTVWDGSAATVIVDAQTNLPITIELDRGKGQDGKPIREVATNFQFNVSIADSTFAILPPNGYRVERMERRDPIVSSESLVLTLGKGVGPIHFGMSLQEVRDQLGPPDSFKSEPDMVPELDEKGRPKFPMKFVPVDPPQTVGRMEYRSLGLIVDVSSIRGVEWIRCFEKRATQNRFEGMTSHGIKIGMSKDEVQSVLDQEGLTVQDGYKFDNVWICNGMNLVFEKDKCVEIVIGKPNFIEQQ